MVYFKEINKLKFKNGFLQIDKLKFDKCLSTVDDIINIMARAYYDVLFTLQGTGGVTNAKY